VHKILFVDDEPVIADTLATIFKLSGYDATAVYSCEEAIEIIDANHPLFIVADVVMPGMNGVDLAKLVYNIYPDSGILLFSGNATTPALLEAADAEGFHFDLMTKPVTPSELLRKVGLFCSTQQPMDNMPLLVGEPAQA